MRRPDHHRNKGQIVVCLVVGLYVSCFLVFVSRCGIIGSRYPLGRPTDNLKYSIVSPDGMHVLQLYQNEGRGATVSESSTVVVSAIGDGRKWRSQESWSVFFSYRYTFMDVEWIDDETIRISSDPEHPSKQFVLTMNIYQDEF